MKRQPTSEPKKKLPGTSVFYSIVSGILYNRLKLVTLISVGFQLIFWGLNAGISWTFLSPSCYHQMRGQAELQWLCLLKVWVAWYSVTYSVTLATIKILHHVPVKSAHLILFQMDIKISWISGGLIYRGTQKLFSVKYLFGEPNIA